MFSNVGKKCFKLWCVLCAVQFVGDKKLSVIKMHGATMKTNLMLGNVSFLGHMRTWHFSLFATAHIQLHVT